MINLPVKFGGQLHLFLILQVLSIETSNIETGIWCQDILTKISTNNKYIQIWRILSLSLLKIYLNIPKSCSTCAIKNRNTIKNWDYTNSIILTLTSWTKMTLAQSSTNCRITTSACIWCTAYSCAYASLTITWILKARIYSVVYSITVWSSISL